MKAEYCTLYQKYNTVLKPLISEQEGRLETFAAPLLESLSRMLDAVSLADACDEEGQKSKYVTVADEALDLSISYSYQYLIFALQKNIAAFEEKAPQNVRNRINGGKFAGPYQSQNNNIVKLLKTCDLQNDDIKSLPSITNWTCGRNLLRVVFFFFLLFLPQFLSGLCWKQTKSKLFKNKLHNTHRCNFILSSKCMLV